MLTKEKVLFFVLMIICLQKALIGSRIDNEYNDQLDYDTVKVDDTYPGRSSLLNSFQKRYNPTDLMRRITALSRKNKNDSLKLFKDLLSLKP